MTTKTRGGALRKVIIAALAAALAVPLGASTALAAPSGPGSVDGMPEYSGPGNGYDGVIDGRAAGANIVKFGTNGTTVETYCVQYDVPIAKSGTFTPVGWAKSGIKNLPNVTSIVSNAAGIGTPLEDKDAEATAIQLAVWHYTDGVDVSTVPNPTIVARANALIDGAKKAVEHPLPVTHVSATADAVETEDGETVVDIHFEGKDGAGLGKLEFSYQIGESGNAVEARTDDAGDYTLTLPMDVDGQDLILEPVISVPAGTVLDPGDGKQIVIVAHAAVYKDVLGPITIPLKVTEFVPEEPEQEPQEPVETPEEEKPAPAPDQEEPPAEETSSDAQERPDVLPRTGTWATPLIFGALILLAGGGAYAYWRLRPEHQ